MKRPGSYKNALIALRLFVKKKSVFLRLSHPEEDRQVGRNIGGLENVSYLHLCLIYIYVYIYKGNNNIII